MRALKKATTHNSNRPTQRGEAGSPGTRAIGIFRWRGVEILEVVLINQGYEPSTRETERILYAYPQIRAYAQVVETQGSGSVMTLGEGDRRQSDSAHQAAVRRDALADIVLTVESTSRSLSWVEPHARFEVAGVGNAVWS